MRVHVYMQDPSESFIQPLVTRLEARGAYTDDWRKADRILYCTDRREAIRHALDCYEYGKQIWHWTDVLPCEGDRWHYDGTYRRMLSELAKSSGGKVLDMAQTGPPHVDDLPDTSRPLEIEPYTLLCWNLLPWAWEPIPLLRGRVLITHPGNNGDIFRWHDEVEHLGYEVLQRMPRPLMLRYLRHAKVVAGNSSALCFEAPIWHPPCEIMQIGKRNQGRPLLYWKGPSPCDTVADMLARDI